MTIPSEIRKKIIVNLKPLKTKHLRNRNGYPTWGKGLLWPAGNLNTEVLRHYVLCKIFLPYT